MLLGLLSQRDLTGYEIKQYLELSHAESWANIKTGSIYYALKKMEENKLVKVDSVKHTGNRSRTIYSITEEGRNFFKKRLEDTLRQPDLNFPNSLYTSFTFLGEISSEKAVQAIKVNIKSLEKELENWKINEQLKEKVQSKPLPNYMKALFKNGRKHIEANIEYLKEILDLLPKESFEVFLPPLDKIIK